MVPLSLLRDSMNMQKAAAGREDEINERSLYCDADSEEVEETRNLIESINYDDLLLLCTIFYSTGAFTVHAPG